MGITSLFLLAFQLLIASLVLLPTGAMTLCEYYRIIGVYKPECETKPDLGDSNDLQTLDFDPFAQRRSMHRHRSYDNGLVSRPFQRQRAAMAVGLETCSGYFHSCYKSSICPDGGSVCTVGYKNELCCTSPGTKCPSPTDLGIRCLKTRTVNWCTADSDCGSVPGHMCCPTGCNYNMCIQDRSYVMPPPMSHDLYKLAKMMDAQCPDPFTLRMQCRSPNPVSWCLSHRDCQANAKALNPLFPRLCCVTPCGNNVCLMKHGDSWIMG